MLTAILISLLCSLSQPEVRRDSHQLSALEQDSLTVYVFLLDECLISQYFTPELTRLYDTYQEKHVGFIGYFPNAISSPERITDFGREYHLSFPLEGDYDKTWVEKFNITVTPEVAVWDHRSDRLIYRGRIDDSYVRVGKRKLHPQHHDLEDMIESWIDGRVPEQLTETQAIGCFINFDQHKE